MKHRFYIVRIRLKKIPEIYGRFALACIGSANLNQACVALDKFSRLCKIAGSTPDFGTRAGFAARKACVLIP